jgi:iron complex transport system substrate-binding protein
MLSRFYIYCAFFNVFFLLFSCKDDGNNKSVKSTLFSSIQHANNFKLIARSYYTELQIINPEKGKIERKYALLSAGQFPKLALDVQPIHIPIKGLISLSATPIGMLHKLKEIPKIKGITHRKYVWNPTLLRNIAANRVGEFENIAQLNPEKVLKTGANVLVFDGFGSYPVVEDKLKKLGVVCLPNYDWRENDPLGKAEWIKLYGVLTGKEKEANRYFEEVITAYKALKNQALKNKQRTSLISGCLIGDLWYMPAGESFSAHIFRDAQFDYQEKNSQGTGSVSFSLEHCLKAHQDASFWIDPGVSSLQALVRLNPKYRFFKAFKTKNIYCYSHNANYFWENSACEPHHLFSDFIEIHKGAASTKKLYFYRKLLE